MQITLRRAGRIRSQIDSYLKDVRTLDTTFQLSIYSLQPATVIAGKLTEFQAKYAEISAVIHALYELRSAIDAANHTSGVSELLNNLAECTRLQDFTVRIVKSATPARNLTELEAQIAAYKEPAYSGYTTDISGSFLDQETIDNLTITTKELKSAINALTAQIDDLNGSTMITLQDADASVLQVAGLL